MLVKVLGHFGGGFVSYQSVKKINFHVIFLLAEWRLYSTEIQSLCFHTGIREIQGGWNRSEKPACNYKLQFVYRCGRNSQSRRDIRPRNVPIRIRRFYKTLVHSHHARSLLDSGNWRWNSSCRRQKVRQFQY